VDGGVRLRLFAEGVMNAVGVAAGEGGAELTGTKTAYYIVNGKLHKTPKPIPSWNWAAILERTLDIVMKEATFGSLYAAWYRLNSDCGDWKFQGSWIPQGQDLPDSGEYDPVDMKALYDAGEVAGLANVWHDGLPDPDYGCLMP
jgi:hypothetical protein